MFTIEGCVFLSVCVGWIKSEIICSNEDDSYNCSEENECCPEGCCPKNFPIPKVSIALALNICTFILLLCFLCWCIQIITTICEKLGIRRSRKSDVPKRLLDDIFYYESQEMTPPPTYSVALRLPPVSTTENEKIPTYDEAVGKGQAT